MKLGFTTYGNLTSLDFAKKEGFGCLEFTSLPGYPNMDLVADLADPGALADFKGQIADSGIEVQSIITAINPMAADPAIAESHRRWLAGLIQVAGKLGIRYVSTTSGQNPTLSLDDNVKLFGQVYRELVRVADDSGVGIVFENCLHGYPSGQNIAVNPETWEKVFCEVDSPSTPPT
jgi:sugar phosphate isomerase/epimerase